MNYYNYVKWRFYFYLLYITIIEKLIIIKKNNLIMKIFLEIIKKSLTSPGGKESSTRIGAYVLLVLIVLFTIIFLVIEIFNGTISNEAIIIFGMLMTHHLVLLGINKHHETKEKTTKINNIRK